MTSRDIRQNFLDFFRNKAHTVVPSAPIVIKNDPTLMFTNAGMNQFKDVFLGEKTAVSSRVADTQKCLRVSGKHNDLEEVGHDTYHHTMFEMLGNWSFGDYFKKEAISWAWELLTEKYKIPADRLYATVFEGEKKEGLPIDQKAVNIWKQFLPTDRILSFSKKDNFWEMGDTGPCGPCSEIHIDLRSDEERKRVPGSELVNTGTPEVIELWNLVFIQYNRKSNGKLNALPQVHVDTGMGFERLCMVLQGKKSTYDSDLFANLLSVIEKNAGIKYGHSDQTDIAMRVIADHIRAITFTIADGQLPSNTGAGYVVRRILRRAVRYGYSFLQFKEPVLFKLVGILANEYKGIFEEVTKQKTFIEKVIKEEEANFLRTLENGLKRLHDTEEKLDKGGIIPGKVIFELYDTYGFPLDLTRLVATEKGFAIDEKGFELEMAAQKERSKDAGQTETGDWQELEKQQEVEFVGYETLRCETTVLKYRPVKQKNKDQFQLVLAKTPFYAESGGQIGDTGKLVFGDEAIEVLDTKRENDLIVHLVNRIPKHIKGKLIAEVDETIRRQTVNNHSATHLLQAALKQVLGNHVRQKGSYVGPDHLRFDFSHFEKVNDQQLREIEKIVNLQIWANTKRGENRDVPIQEALDMGATAIFGEKYGEKVRVIIFDPAYSIELCGGTHVEATGQIGLFKITSESAIAAGVRRIEAVTGESAFSYFQDKLDQLEKVGALTKSNKDFVKGVESLIEENQQLKKNLEALSALQVNQLKEDLMRKSSAINGFDVIGEIVEITSPESMKNLAFELKKANNTLVILGASIDGKPLLTIAISDDLVKEKGLHAGNLVKEAAREIQGGGGGQPFYATAGGSKPDGLQKAIDLVRDRISKI